MKWSCSVQFVHRLFLLSALLMASAFSLFAQDATGRIVGNAYDQSGAVIPGAHIVITNTATLVTRETVTDSAGYYQVLALPIGAYTVTAAHKGFNPIVTNANKLEINQSLKIDVKLAVGTNAEVVTVEGTAGTVETINPTMGSTVSEREVADAPLNGRNALDLALLQPGVLPSDNPNNTSAASATTAFSISGGRNDSNTFLLDGGLNNDLLDNGVVFNPNPDAIQEFKVLTSNFTAEYGRNGGGIITVVTKSGTNRLHGSAFEYNRNTAFNANDFFSNNASQPRAILQRNQYGGTVGGPIKKDKLFFFAAYEGTREKRVIPSGTVPVFTPAELQGDFSGSSHKAAVASFLQANPAFQSNAALAAQGIIDPNTFDPVAKAYIKNGLIPSAQNGQAQFQNPSTQQPQELTGKFDWEINSKDHFTATLGRRQNPQLNVGPGGIPGFNSNTTTHQQFFNFAYTRIVSPTMLNEFRVTSQRNDILQAVPVAKLPTPQALGINITPDVATGPTRMDFPGLNIGFSIQGPTSLIDNSFAYSDTFTWTRGKHTMKFGGSFSAFQNNQTFDFIVDGLFDFSRFDPNTGLPNFGAGDAHANFLLGMPVDFAQFPAAPSNIRTKATYVFGQDEWHVASNLVLTLGLRYEYSNPKSDTKGRLFDVIPGFQSKVFPHAPVGLTFPGDAGAPTGANFSDKNDFAPRFGFAWQPRHDSKTSVRGGIGVFYDILKAEDNFQFNGQFPFAGAASFGFPNVPPSGFLGDPFGASGTPNPFPSKPVDHNIDFSTQFLGFGGGSTFFVDPHIRTPYTFQYNLSIEREISNKMTLEAAYVGSASHKLTALKDINPFDPKTINGPSPQRILNETPGNVQADNVNFVPGSFSFLQEFTNSSDANYNALQLALRKQPTSLRFLGTTYFTLGYTYAHGIDDSSGFRQLASSTVPFFTPHIFRASSDFDLRHVFTFSGGWDLPFSRGPQKLVKGWSLFPILSYRTGFPLTVNAGLGTQALDPGPSGAGDSGLVNADLVGPIGYTSPHSSQNLGGTSGFFFFNPNAFSATSTAPYGTSPRNVLRGPGRTNLDMSLAKSTPFYGDRVRLELRVDAFNLFNHTQFRTIDSGIADPTFGQATDAYNPRELQLAAHIRF